PLWLVSLAVGASQQVLDRIERVVYRFDPKYYAPLHERERGEDARTLGFPPKLDFKALGPLGRTGFGVLQEAWGDTSVGVLIYFRGRPQPLAKEYLLRPKGSTARSAGWRYPTKYLTGVREDGDVLRAKLETSDKLLYLDAQLHRWVAEVRVCTEGCPLFAQDPDKGVWAGTRKRFLEQLCEAHASGCYPGCRLWSYTYACPRCGFQGRDWAEVGQHWAGEHVTAHGAWKVAFKKVNVTLCDVHQKEAALGPDVSPDQVDEAAGD
ncbi:hypothetical protein OAX78_04695, partial [Planctomycetota bacterium]|nr:hypothetical protein [Planctomycetota bacterium]